MTPPRIPRCIASWASLRDRTAAAKTIGVDVSGTFTDLVYCDLATGRHAIHKVPTTPDDPSVAVVQDIAELCARHGIPAGEVEHVLHGTTTAINAVLENRGARTGMVTNEGFRDLIHIARHQRVEHYSIMQELPWQSRPLVRRRHAKVVKGRLVAPHGAELAPRRVRAPARAGARVEDRELPASYGALRDAHPTVMDGEAARAFGWELAASHEMLSGFRRERLAAGLGQPPEALLAARETMRRLREGFASAMAGLDVLVTPAAPGEAPAGLEWTGDAAFNYVWTSLHVPCVTMPAGTGPSGMPLGLQVVGRFGEDRATLAWAQWVAHALS